MGFCCMLPKCISLKKSLYSKSVDEAQHWIVIGLNVVISGD